MKTVNNFVQSERLPFPESIRAFLPQYAIVPFTQMKGESYHCAVQENQTVTEGQIIALPNSNTGGGATIHSPVPGKVTEIITCSLPDGKMSQAVRIHVSGSFTYLGKKQNQTNWKQYSADEIQRLFSDRGVVNTFDETEPLAAQIIDSRKLKHRILVVRLFDEDPSRMTDSFVSVHNENAVLEGARIIAKSMGAECIVFAVPKKSLFDFSSLTFDGSKDILSVTVSIDTAKYPSGFKVNIMQAIEHDLKGTAPVFEKVSRKNLCIDSETALSAYEAIVLGIPVLERYVHVTGSCLRSAGMFKVRIGTTIESLAKQCGGFKMPPAKIIINGLITGFAVSRLNTPITKQVKSVMFVPGEELSDQQLSPCIRCGKCRAICPEGIFPDLVFRHQTGGKPVGDDLVKTAELCSECCLCNSVCPARLPLCQTIELVKESVHE